jgi:tetratricopeptide (TPR) repeat protein
MKHPLATLLLTASLLSSIPAPAQSMPSMSGHHHEAVAVTPEQLGQVHFPITCAPSSQAPFTRGIALLHSFGYTLAEQQFQAIATSDPTCAMAYWGLAMAHYQELWGQPDATAIKLGASEMAKARHLATASKTAASKTAASPQTSPRELAYIKAMSDFYALAPHDYQQAADAYSADMAALHTAFPNDVEGAAFYALSLIADVAPDDTSLTKERAALAVLLPLFHKYPDHPGLAHYIIHTCDTPALAPEGLQAAEVYAKIAPSSPHALHMPSHIFARLGMWQPDIASNLASLAASQKDEAAHQPGAAHQMHADEFLIYAWLQTGEDAKARNLTNQFRSISDRMAALPYPDDMKFSGPDRDNRIRVIFPMEMHDWNTLAALTPDPGTTGESTFAIDWGQGVAAGHLHDPKLAAAALTHYDAVLAKLKASSDYADANAAQIERNEIVAWRAFTLNHPAAAITAMRMAADQQDKLGQGEVDIPAREMLGDLYMSLNQPREALVAYKASLKLSPNRLNGLLGAAAAAEAIGDDSAAKSFYEQVARNTSNAAHTYRPGVLHAIHYNATHSTVASNTRLKASGAMR